MNAKKWITYFEQNKGIWKEPGWKSDTCDLEANTKRLLIDSLATFQLGESGGGTRIRKFAQQSDDGSASYLDAVDLFVAEEQYHAEILAKAVHYLGGKLKRKYWINSVFRKVRGLIGLNFSLQILLTAELIAEAYYGLLSKHLQDPVIRSMCKKITKDEVKHIQFHEEFFRMTQLRWLPISSLIWELQFQAIFFIVEAVVWLDHGKCLRAFGISRKQFRGRANSVCRRFLGKVGRFSGSLSQQPSP